MKDYYQKDVPILLKLAEHKEVLDGFPTESANSQYDARLIYNQRKPEEVQLKIYYKPSDHLYEKFRSLAKAGVSILDMIQPAVSPHKWVNPEFFEFSENSLIGIQETHYYDHDKKFLILVLQNFCLFENGRYAGDARFRLGDNAISHLAGYIQYGQLGTYDSDDKFIERNENRWTSFGPVEFMLSLNHSYKQGEPKKDFVITRDAELIIRDDSQKIKDLDLLSLGEDLCLMMSLYWEKSIDFFNALLRVNDRENYGTREVFKLSGERNDLSQEFHLKDKYSNIYDFAESIDFDKFQYLRELIREAVPRLISIKHLDDISAFMVLYNIVEKFRNFFLKNPLDGQTFTVKEEYAFIGSEGSINKFIKTKIKEIGEIVEEDDKLEFDSKAFEKVSFIKKTGLIDQFEGFIKYLKLDPGKYNIEFDQLIKVRNLIYHGNPPGRDLSPYNKELKALVYDILLAIIAR
ncbi:hypothetical protein K6T82_10835 [Flavobacterium sp. 17A]|uniref:ApeA N-terminal domain-containing protein n=1 Tax=Flavobacterium potami TaxID=2872310 RepID=A0A9X1H9K5_9FLAO|nr:MULTISPECIES: hypothetical protein [Flavobacterium]MBZ4035264.1 hypothetical protein [Flavobacterium potami]WET02506.1 hypothetical protein P0R33_22385 [Flavobacterium sp. YJ01]